MMHMWMWFGYDLGDFLFPGLVINTRWAFALTWIVLFFVALLFEGSKVYLARVQRDAHKTLHPHGSDERRNLLCDRDREQGNAMEPTTSRNTSSGQVSRWASFKIRTLVNCNQTLVFVGHNLVGYLLMLAVMVYNVHLLLAVVFGMMLGYFLFGTKLTRLQMQCFSTKRTVICTPECDDTAESTTPPLLNTSIDSQSDVFVCQTRACIQPSHYFPANSQDGGEHGASCYYGAKRCPSKVAKVRKMQSSAHRHRDSEKEDSPAVEDAQLLRNRHGCCQKPEPLPEEECCKSSQSTAAVIHEEIRQEEAEAQGREASPQISCCRSKSTRDSQEQIVT